MNKINSLVKSFDIHSLLNVGEKIYAFVTNSGRQVIKIEQSRSDITKHSLVRYPGTGTVVETVVHKEHKY